jgi:cold shock CspA family protein/DNA polymerase III delta prime subunit
VIQAVDRLLGQQTQKCTWICGDANSKSAVVAAVDHLRQSSRFLSICSYKGISNTTDRMVRTIAAHCAVNLCEGRELFFESFENDSINDLNSYADFDVLIGNPLKRFTEILLPRAFRSMVVVVQTIGEHLDEIDSLLSVKLLMLPDWVKILVISDTKRSHTPDDHLAKLIQFVCAPQEHCLLPSATIVNIASPPQQELEFAVTVKAIENSEMEFIGSIVKVVAKGRNKGYGYISSVEKENVFFRSSSFADRNRFRVRRGYEVAFSLAKDAKDRVCASLVKLTPAGRAAAEDREDRIATQQAVDTSVSSRRNKQIPTTAPTGSSGITGVAVCLDAERFEEPRQEQKKRSVKQAASDAQNSTRTLIEQNKNDVTVSVIDFGTRTITCGQRAECKIRITNNDPMTRTVRTTIAHHYSNTFSVFDNTGDLRGRSLEISPFSFVEIMASACNLRVCRENAFFYFHFGSFAIGRFVEMEVVDINIAAAIKITKEFSRAKRTVKKPRGDNELEGNRLVPTCEGLYIKPAAYTVPTDLRRLYFDDQTAGAQMLLELRSTAEYSTFLHHLLWFEELSMMKDILQYDMENVPAELRGNLFRISVPGLLDDRPSVLRNDEIRANIVGDIRNVLHKGYVHSVLRDAVDVSFHERLLDIFRKDRKMLLNIEFTVNRSVLKRMHQATDHIMTRTRWKRWLQLEESGVVIPDVNENAVVNRIRVQQGILRKLNPEQSAAVTHVANNDSKGRPYIIFGPPGTGKTTTLVAAINAVRQHRVSADREKAALGSNGVRVLVCAPSNAAVDVLLTRLAEHNPKTDMFRYMSYQRKLDSIDLHYANKILSYSNYQGGHFPFPGLDEFLQYNIVVCTCAMAGTLYNYGVPRGHFDVVFVDEAGHAIESELLAAFAWNLSDNGQLIIAGDPKQLGPVVRSKIAASVGLEISFLERLAGLPGSPYEKNPDMYKDIRTHYNDNFITKLTKCYRCHPDILKIPNDFFYDGELEAFADPAMCNNLLTWDQLPNKRFPLLFVGVEGKEEQEESCPSYCNLSEVHQVVETVKQLMFFKGMKSVGLGIITPYFKQSQKIKKGLKAANKEYEDILVGSCEKFQGQERRAIIISTVRSTTNYMEAPKKDSLGFLVNPKRFNVAITRAKALVVVIGNPNSLCQDKHWNALIRYCAEHGACTGVPPPADNNHDSNGGASGMGGSNSNHNRSNNSSSATAASAGSSVWLR